MYSAALCLCTSGGEGCGKGWPDRCRRRKGEMRWYVPYSLCYSVSAISSRSCRGLHPAASWVNKFPLNIVGVEKVGYPKFRLCIVCNFIM